MIVVAVNVCAAECVELDAMMLQWSGGCEAISKVTNFIFCSKINRSWMRLLPV